MTTRQRILSPLAGVLAAALLALGIAACSAPAGGAAPGTVPALAWLDSLIKTWQSEPVGNPPRSVYSYDYKGQTVYYVPPQAGDQYSQLYDTQGNLICAPDGGLTGKGDGKCPDFASQASNKVLIWQDSRTR